MKQSEQPMSGHVNSEGVLRILIVEDQTQDAILAAEIARGLGIIVNVKSAASAAKLHLEDAIDGKVVMPDIILLDLDLGYESGFELLRFWHRSPKLAPCRVIVWTRMGEQRDICKLFGVHAIVVKSDGPSALNSVLSAVVVDALR